MLLESFNTFEFKESLEDFRLFSSLNGANWKESENEGGERV